MRFTARAKAQPANCQSMAPQEPSPKVQWSPGVSVHTWAHSSHGTGCDCPAGQGDSRGWAGILLPSLLQAAAAAPSSPQPTYHCSHVKPQGLQCHPQINHRGTRNIWGSSGDLGERNSSWGIQRTHPDHPHPTKPHKHPKTLSLFYFIIFHQLMWNCDPYLRPGTNKFKKFI